MGQEGSVVEAPSSQQPDVTVGSMFFSYIAQRPTSSPRAAAKPKQEIRLVLGQRLEVQLFCEV